MADFYTTVLGIPPGARPPNHYALLGLTLFDDDPDEVEAAYSRQRAILDSQPFDEARPAGEVEHVLAILETARQTLLDTQGRRAYNCTLAAKLGVAPPDPSAPVIDRRHCPKCATAIGSEQELCGHCGFDLKSKTPAPGSVEAMANELEHPAFQARRRRSRSRWLGIAVAALLIIVALGFAICRARAHGGVETSDATPRSVSQP